MTKINFTISQQVKDKIEGALRKYGDFEVGGILIARKVDSDIFDVVDASISSEDNRLSVARFIRGTQESERLLKQHYEQKTGYYVGEWHSHPRFSLDPSHADVLTMLQILNDKSYGVSFVILMIAHLDKKELKYKGYFFHKDLKEILLLE